MSVSFISLGYRRTIVLGRRFVSLTTAFLATYYGFHHNKCWNTPTYLPSHADSRPHSSRVGRKRKKSGVYSECIIKNTHGPCDSIDLLMTSRPVRTKMHCHYRPRNRSSFHGNRTVRRVWLTRPHDAKSDLIGSCMNESFEHLNSVHRYNKRTTNISYFGQFFRRRH